MPDKVLKDKATKTLTILDKHIKLLRATIKTVVKLKAHAAKHDLHKRAIYSHTTLVGLDFLVAELESGRSLCMELLGAKKVDIIVERKLKLVVNNENGGD